MKKIDVKKLIMIETKKIGETRNIESVSVKDICERCGISRPTFYTYFRDKYDLVNEIYHYTISESFFSTDRSAPWPIILGTILDNIRKDGQFYMNSVQYSGQNSLTEMMQVHTAKGYLRETARRSGSDPDESLMNEIRFASFGTTGMIVEWIRDGYKRDPYKVAMDICSSLPEGMKKYFI